MTSLRQVPRLLFRKLVSSEYAQLVTLYDVTPPGTAAVVQEAGQLRVRSAGDAV